MNNYILAYTYNREGDAIDIINGQNGGLLGAMLNVHAIACIAIETTIDTDCTADDNWTPESMTENDFRLWFTVNSIEVDLDHEKKQYEFIHDTFKATALFIS